MQLLLDNCTIRLAGIELDSVVDGEGVRMAIFTQGCPHHCQGCHNQHTWDPKGGYDAKIGVIFEQMASLTDHKGITLTGGEPFEQECQCYMIAKMARELGLDIWVYTGYLYEELRKEDHPLLAYTDILVDGRYILERKTVDIPYIGSHNQRIILMHSNEHRLNLGA
jgi:anaerobic ribonucleoside-triphosphate reductase activating protein